MIYAPTKPWTAISSTYPGSCTRYTVRGTVAMVYVSGARRVSMLAGRLDRANARQSRLETEEVTSAVTAIPCESHGWLHEKAARVPLHWLLYTCAGARGATELTQERAVFDPGTGCLQDNCCQEMKVCTDAWLIGHSRQKLSMRSNLTGPRLSLYFIPYF